MDIDIPSDEKKLFKQIWKINGLQNKPLDELVFDVSYKMNLNYPPSWISKKIKIGLEKRYLIKKGNKIALSDELLSDLKKENILLRNNFKKMFPTQCIEDRIEDNIERWRFTQGKSQAQAVDSSEFNNLMKSVFNKEEIARGQSVESKKVHYFIQDDEKLLLEATVDGSKGEKYILNIDLKNKTIIHDCHDFVTNRISQKEFCKHFFRTLIGFKTTNPKLGMKILESLKNRQNWKFLQE